MAMVKVHKRRDQWAPKREPDDFVGSEELLPLPSDPFLKHAHDHPSLGNRLWLYHEEEAEPSLPRWIAAFVAIDQRKNQKPLADLLRSHHPLQRYAQGH